MKYLVVILLAAGVGVGGKLTYDSFRPRTQMEICLEKVALAVSNDVEASLILDSAVAISGKTKEEILTEACQDYFDKGGAPLSSE